VVLRKYVEAAECPWLSESPTSGSVAPGNDVDITVSIDTSGLSVGDYSAEIYVSNNDPDENPKMVPVTLHVVLMPDLVVTEKYEEWVDFEAGSYNISYTVTNQGDAAAGASTTIIDIDFTSHLYRVCPALDPGASDSITLGPYVMFGDSDTIRVCADYGEVVSECDETNNCETNIIGLMEGDASQNGCVSIGDAMFIAQYLFGLRSFSADQLECADTYDDGLLAIGDAMHIAQWLFDPDGYQDGLVLGDGSEW